MYLTILFSFLTSFFNLIISDIKNNIEIKIKDITNIRLGCISLYFFPLYHIYHIQAKQEIKII